MEDRYALGLDLGTTFSCIGVYKNGEVEIIPNRNGDKITPSIVTIIDDETILKCEDALGYLVKNYDSSIYAIKRFIGRDYNDKQVQEDIKKENFPFQIVGDPKSKNPLVKVIKNNKEIKFTLEEISSFVIKKLVENAEKYLGGRVDKLVITVPANFNNAQRNCTKQAALLADIEVLRIINEPTAAALAYGLQDKQNISNGKILVFDLGGGTFDVTILSINKKSEENFDIISTNGDKFLGGEDFDNKLVHYFLDNFCRKMNENKDEILKNKKIIKNLKISCENIKKVLSSSNFTTINITNFYNKKDMIETISREEFEDLCKDLFEKLKIPLKKAIKDARIAAEDISEIVLVGGSTRIPKIKSFLMEYFGSNCKINDSINPDEAVAYGATLMAAKIVIKRDKNLSAFNLMDITPLSLGIEVLNNSKNKKILEEGLLMSVIIKRATKIPFNNSEIYVTAYDNQKEAKIQIYEGEKKYVKYNHVLGELLLKGLTPKPKGQVKIKVKFFIDVNGILTVTAAELSEKGEEIKPIETQIEYQSIGLNKEKIEELKKKNQKYFKKIKTSLIKNDFSNTRQELNELEEALNETDDEEDRFNILMSYNNIYEEFINSFSQNDFDNETMYEKYYMYLKELFESYTKALNINTKIDSIEENKTEIKNKIIEYLKIFTLKSSGYLNELLNILQKAPKKIFLEIVVFTMEQINNNGKKCLEERKEFCRYNCLKYFEKAYSIFVKYIINLSKLAVCPRPIAEKGKAQLRICLNYINDVKTGSILLLEDSIKEGKLIKSNNTGFTNSLLNFKFTNKEETEKNEILLQNYEKLLREMKQDLDNTPNKKKSTPQPQLDIKEAICIANIVKISSSFLGKTNKRLLKLCERCKIIADDLGIDSNVEWYKEFCELYEQIKTSNEIVESSLQEKKDKITKNYKSKFDEIEKKFNKKKNDKEFIQFVLDTYPYEGYENDKKENKLNYSDEQELLQFLRSKYHPDQYECPEEDEQLQLKYFIVELIESYFNNMYDIIQ